MTIHISGPNIHYAQYGVKLSENNQVLDIKENITDSESANFEIVFRVEEGEAESGNGYFSITLLKIPTLLLGKLRVQRLGGSWNWNYGNVYAVISDPYGNNRTILLETSKSNFKIAYKDLFSKIICSCSGIENVAILDLLEKGQDLLETRHTNRMLKIVSFLKDFKSITMQASMWNEIHNDTRVRVSAIADKLLAELEVFVNGNKTKS